MLTQAISEEQHEIDRIGMSLSDLAALDRLRAAFDGHYGPLRDREPVRATHRRFDVKREAILAANTRHIRSEIQAAQSIDAVERLERRYLAGLDPSTAEVQALQHEMQQRRDTILDAERRQRIAAQAATERREQQAREAAAAVLAAENAEIETTGLSVRGLRNDALVRALFTGAFEDIDLKREDPRFVELYSSYLLAFGERCTDALPPDRVPITRQECREETTVSNGWGVVVNRYCSAYRTVPTGFYADPEMYRVQSELELLQIGDAFRNIIGLLSSDNPIGETLGLVGDAVIIQRDMVTLVSTNSCNGAALRRFQDNLHAFASNERPKRLDSGGEDSPVITPRAGTLFEDPDYQRFLDDLVRDQARSWVINQYHGGSVSGIVVQSRDALGRPVRVLASYIYSGMSDRATGHVTLTFKDGWPTCLYFSDNPVACRTPSRQIVARYADGAYSN